MLIRIALAALVLIVIAGCATDDPLKSTYDGCTATRAAVRATDAAYLSGKLSKADAEKAFTGFAAMSAGCTAAANALQAAAAASAASAPK